MEVQKAKMASKTNQKGVARVEKFEEVSEEEVTIEDVFKEAGLDSLSDD